MNFRKYHPDDDCVLINNETVCYARYQSRKITDCCSRGSSDLLKLRLRAVIYGRESNSYLHSGRPPFYNTFEKTVMNHSLIVKPGLLLAILTIGLVNYSPVQAGVKDTTPQNQKQLKQQSKQLAKPQSSQQLWQQFRSQQDGDRLRQQHRIEQIRLQNQLRQRPLGQHTTMDQLRQQQRLEMDRFQLQQQSQQEFRQQQLQQ
ncbi:MAG: hypothetical protein RMX35_18200 [Nostoc sp. DcaGUA01]|nr:hypothetical protein [Nostoc sp. SerVER01]MDZ8080987.1 hypothetical protein [Nostoc sp. DcaGUA01]